MSFFYSWQLRKRYHFGDKRSALLILSQLYHHQWKLPFEDPPNRRLRDLVNDCSVLQPFLFTFLDDSRFNLWSRNWKLKLSSLETSRKIAKFVCDLKISSIIHSSHNTKLALVIMYALIGLILNGKNKNVSEYWI